MDRARYFEGIEAYRLLAKHEVGQNFLVDSDAAERIVGLLDVQAGEKVIEIGSGAGSLTYFLAETQGDIEAIDIGEGLVVKVQGELSPRVNVHMGNGAKTDYAPYDKIIGNLPYYITSLLIERALLTGNNAKKMVFMVQKEAGERLLADVGSKDYGPLPILIRLLCKAQRAFTVRRNCFAPAPHVDSVVLTFTMKQEREALANKAYALAQSLFLQRRKTMLNNLKNYLHDGDKAKRLLTELGIAENLRPEQVSPDLFLALTKALDN